MSVRLCVLELFAELFQAGSYMFKGSNRNTRAGHEICSKITIKTSERQWRRSGVFIVNLNVFHILF